MIFKGSLVNFSCYLMGISQFFSCFKYFSWYKLGNMHFSIFWNLHSNKFSIISNGNKRVEKLGGMDG